LGTLSSYCTREAPSFNHSRLCVNFTLCEQLGEAAVTPQSTSTADTAQRDVSTHDALMHAVSVICDCSMRRPDNQLHESQPDLRSWQFLSRCRHRRHFIYTDGPLLLQYTPPLVRVRSQINPVDATPAYLISILILHSHLSLCHPNGLFRLGFIHLHTTHVLHATPISSSSHFITPVMTGKESSFLHPPVTSSL
jgi:hypothetical protein